MKAQPPHDPWSRLAAAARQVREDRDTSIPYGFATRVAALAMATERRGSALLERFALRAVGLAALLAITSIAVNYGEITAVTPPVQSTVAMGGMAEELDVLPADDAVAIVLDLAD